MAAWSLMFSQLVTSWEREIRDGPEWVKVPDIIVKILYSTKNPTMCVRRRFVGCLLGFQWLCCIARTKQTNKRTKKFALQRLSQHAVDALESKVNTIVKNNVKMNLWRPIYTRQIGAKIDECKCLIVRIFATAGTILIYLV